MVPYPISDSGQPAPAVSSKWLFSKGRDVLLLPFPTPAGLSVDRAKPQLFFAGSSLLSPSPRLQQGLRTVLWHKASRKDSRGGEHWKKSAANRSLC